MIFVNGQGEESHPINFLWVSALQVAAPVIEALARDLRSTGRVAAQVLASFDMPVRKMPGLMAEEICTCHGAMLRDVLGSNVDWVELSPTLATLRAFYRRDPWSAYRYALESDFSSRGSDPCRSALRKRGSSAFCWMGRAGSA
jgi:hypothetical protein